MYLFKDPTFLRFDDSALETNAGAKILRGVLVRIGRGVIGLGPQPIFRRGETKFYLCAQTLVKFWGFKNAFGLRDQIQYLVLVSSFFGWGGVSRDSNFAKR